MNNSHDNDSDDKTRSLLARRYSDLIWRRLAPIGLEIGFVSSQRANVQCDDFFESHNNKSKKPQQDLILSRRYLVERLDTIVSREDLLCMIDAHETH